MLTDALRTEFIHLLTQSLDRIRHCVDQLNHHQLWWQPAEGQHSVGILLRHLTGNLQQWAVDGIPQQENTRERSAEFESPNQQPAEELLSHLTQVVDSAISVIETLEEPTLLDARTVQGFSVTVLGSLLHTVPHFVGHTHQIVMLTRMQLVDNYQFHWSPDSPRNKVPL